MLEIPILKYTKVLIVTFFWNGYILTPAFKGNKSRIVGSIYTIVEDSAPRKIGGKSECHFFKTVDKNKYFQNRGKLQNRLEASKF